VEACACAGGAIFCLAPRASPAHSAPEFADTERDVSHFLPPFRRPSMRTYSWFLSFRDIICVTRFTVAMSTIKSQQVLLISFARDERRFIPRRTLSQTGGGRTTRCPPAASPVATADAVAGAQAPQTHAARLQSRQVRPSACRSPYRRRRIVPVFNERYHSAIAYTNLSPVSRSQSDGARHARY